jgi:hypothetical protein
MDGTTFITIGGSGYRAYSTITQVEKKTEDKQWIYCVDFWWILEDKRRKSGRLRQLSSDYPPQIL